VNARVGVAGLGRMGTAMALRLCDAGHAVTAWNRNTARAAPLAEAGATLAASPAELAALNDVIVVMVLDDAAALDVYTAGQGLLSRSLAGKLVIEMSTLRPATVCGLGERVRGAGGAFLEAPVSGTVGPARNGQLLALVGADAADLERARQVLDSLCRRIVHAGPVGHGALLKLVVNLPLAVYWAALAEAIALGRAGGLGYELMLDTLLDSSAALKVLGLKIPAILGGDDKPAFELGAMLKDLGYMLEAGSSRGVPMPTTSATHTTYAAAAASGLGTQDSVAVVKFLAERTTRGGDR
jgi:3-hydroxyisobutyrate dehydrogenase